MSTWALESMAEVFTGTLEFSWYRSKSPNVVANKIDELALGLNDPLPPMVAARQIVIDDINDRFERQVDLDEVPWQELSDKYGKWKETNYPGKTILKLEDHLIDALNETSAWPITQNGKNLFVNTDNFPPYWRIHDRGGYTTGGFPGKAGPAKKKIPKRSYLGISDKASFEVLGVFDDWMVDELRIIIGPATGVAMERGVGGRIASRIGMGRQIKAKPLFQLRNV